MSEILELFKSDVVAYCEFGGELRSEHWSYLEWEAPVHHLASGTVTVEERFGGEGQGDQYWIVFRLDTPDQRVHYFRVDGWYASYDGGYYDGDVYEVHPKQKTVTVYE